MQQTNRLSLGHQVCASQLYAMHICGHRSKNWYERTGTYKLIGTKHYFELSTSSNAKVWIMSHKWISLKLTKRLDGEPTWLS